ncbi:MAG: glycosyltransferase family 39 protein, partial [Cytophagia bacterium]|nr:glycosyltransferase family 39 protein [Cytophagia bacterium]
MRNIWSYITLQASHRKQVLFLMIFVSLVYLFNFGVNDIWTPNESFYAESVREMFESNNFLDIFYNYEPRYNKPPLTYWSMALSAGVFGLNEFSLRLPILLMGLGSIWLTYLIGKILYGEKAGLYAMIMMAFSLQLLAVKQYASPEMPLTFFFTLTMYWFLKGYQNERFNYILLSYLALGLTVLTKGYPYIIVIGGIIGSYILWDNWGHWKQLLKKVGFLRLHIGIPLVTLIGLSWIIYMYIQDGQEFWTVYKRETFDRAFTRESNGLKPFFYWEVMTWTIIPYSITFFFALIYWLVNWRRMKEVAFQMSWFLVMLVIFTIAKGKIPTYFIQAHPALILLIVPLVMELKVKGFGRFLWNFSFGISAPILIAFAFYYLNGTNSSIALYLLPITAIGIFLIWLINPKTPDCNIMMPFGVMALFSLTLSSYFPEMEKFRPYDEIGEVINTNPDIGKDTPIYIENTLIHNIPFYAKREAIRDFNADMLGDISGAKLILIKSENLSDYPNFEKLWSGLIYDFPSESQFFKFVMACIAAENGDYSKFA